MDSLQQARLNSYQTIETHCNNNAAIVATIPAFQNAFNDFKAKIVEIIAADRQQNIDLTGITADKAQLKKTLCERASIIAGAIFAFASTNSNNELKQQMNVSLSKLLKTSDNQLAARCRNIHDTGAANLDVLKDYGINAAKLTALQTDIDEYAAAAPKPRAVRTQRKTATGSLRELFKQADQMLEERMDPLIGLLKETNPDFAATYANAREIDDPSTTTTQLKGVITDKTGGSPIKGATVTVVDTAQTMKTDSTGEYLFKPIIFGKHTLRVTKEGFNDFEDDEVEVKLGTVNHLDVILVNS